MLALSLTESLSLLGGAALFGLLLYLILRPLRVILTIKHDPPPSDEDGIIPEDKEE